MLYNNDDLDSIKRINSDGIEVVYPKEKNQDVLGIFEKRDNDSALGMTNGTFTANLINNAVFEDKSYDDFCDEWNKAWEKSNE